RKGCVTTRLRGTSYPGLEDEGLLTLKGFRHRPLISQLQGPFQQLRALVGGERVALRSRPLRPTGPAGFLSVRFAFGDLTLAVLHVFFIPQSRAEVNLAPAFLVP